MILLVMVALTLTLDFCRGASPPPAGASTPLVVFPGLGGEEHYYGEDFETAGEHIE